MLTKRFFSISLLLPLVALSAAAHAGSTITDKSYWPSEARPVVHVRAVSQNSSRDAFAYSPTAADENGSGWNYRYPGSPRSQVTHPGGR
jgi:hypothetical protein